MADKKNYYEILEVSKTASEDEINRAVKEAEEYAAEDRARKEKLENKNRLDGLIFSVEQAINDDADGKFTDEEKQAMQDAANEANADLESGDDDKITAAYDKLADVVQPIFAHLYQNGEMPQGGGVGGDDDDEVVLLSLKSN